MTIALEMKQITKEFPGVKALDRVTFQVKKGEIHALCGENGAGKSTLMKVLSGVYPYGSYEGSIEIEGTEQTFRSIKDAEKAGVAIIYQELALVKEMSVTENLFLGKEHAKFGVIDAHRQHLETAYWLEQVGLSSIHPETVTGTLGIGQQQLVEIAKALSKDAKILILDEPTAALTEKEVEILLDILRKFRERGVSCIYISHKLNEVFSISDSITILRDGKTIATKSIDEVNEDQVISLMVGRELKDRFPREASTPGDIVLELANYSVTDRKDPNKKIIRDVSFQLRKGEIVGIAGLMGSGRTELAMSLFGALDGRSSGTVKIEGKPVMIKQPEHAIAHGIALVTEDRKRTGLVLERSIQDNITLPSLKQVSSWTGINSSKEVSHAMSYFQKLGVKAPSLETVVGTLSGGNQQKVVLGKWLMTKPKVLILDEPTRGVDVGAKYEIYQIMNELVREGVSILMISSELPEVLGMSHRILVMAEGSITAKWKAEEATQERIMTAATGGNQI
ncbi:xylose ABC transporter ATP-binding protein [Thermoactinomyces sp. DSM 45892]|uniref:xylose ABC transporter ATP-binding protein n=1 Tax=Thermoactinomyces sp. DSM 45892 TaxID=1882753 RepID=UPI00089CCAF0|nr:xylose ABC transporter ATP-binding protein [Thermoactinomyces sp. DSM 45892]SDZ16739.1 xylose ABC transporter ATP-binding protein [Thermoactinomyces sp. DSM 45892]